MVGAAPPTSHLPPIKRITGESLESLNDYINYLRSIYNPEVRGSRRRRKSHSARAFTIDAIAPHEAYLLNHLRADPFERAYAIKWLTSLVSFLYVDTDENSYTSQDKEKTTQNAASLLAMCAGTSAAGTVVRDFTFAYQSPPGGNEESITPITIQLTDISLDNDDFGSVGAQTWGGSCVLSDLIVEEPHTFGLSADRLNTHERGLFRILELGAGTGLVSLTVGKLLHQIGLDWAHRIEVVATDNYPSVLTNLRTNVQNNVCSTANSSVSISVHQLDWSSFTSEKITSPPFDEPFDMILGADIVYEPQHAIWIHSCISHLLRKPSGTILSQSFTQAFFHLIIPLRATHPFESNSVEAVFVASPDSHQQYSLEILAKDAVTCDTETGEEVEYIYYKVGWN